MALRPGRDGRRLAALLDSLDHPAEVALVEACPQEAARLCARPLTRTSAAVLDRVEMGAWRPLEATSPDGAAVHGWLLTPPRRSSPQAGQKLTAPEATCTW